jgi:shikimate kinase
MRHIVLVGMMGSGKTTVGRILQRRTQRVLYDTDKVVEEREGKTIPEIFATEGEIYFRKAEAAVIEELTSLPASIISTGGGAFLNPESRQRLLETGIVFYLKANAEILASRVRSGRGRPLLEQADELVPTIRQMLVQREPVYEESHHVVLTDHRSLDGVVEQILQLFPGPY